MKSALIAVVLALLVSACTPTEVQTWLTLHGKPVVDESTAVVVADWLNASPVIDTWVDLGHGIFGPPVLLRVRPCESSNDYTAQNPHTSASGGFQFLRSSWDWYGHAARYGTATAAQALPWQQDEAAVITWQRDGTRPWDPSRGCWR